MDSQGDFGHNSHASPASVPICKKQNNHLSFSLHPSFQFRLWVLCSGSLSQNTPSSQHTMFSSKQLYGNVSKKKKPKTNNQKNNTENIHWWDKTTSTTMQRTAVICGRIISLCHKCHLFFKTQVIPFHRTVNSISTDKLPSNQHTSQRVAAVCDIIWKVSHLND